MAKNKNEEVKQKVQKAEKPELNSDMENAEVIDSVKEPVYQKVVNLMNSMKCMSDSNDKVDMYLKTAKQFSELEGYKDSKECAIKCRQLADKTGEEIKKAIYKRAKDYKANAKQVEEYKSAANEFRKINGYMDADTLAAQCDQFCMEIEKKSVRKSIVKKGIILLCILALIIGSTTSHAKYYLANTLMVTGSYESAIRIYNKLGPYKNSDASRMKCQYKMGARAEKKGEFLKAEEAYANAKGYQDSAAKQIEMIKQMIKNSKLGKAVKIGKFKWIILAVENDRALLMKKAPVKEIVYQDTTGDVTWENSDLRQFLNNQFLKEAFSENVRRNIILTNVKNDDNPLYGTDGGKDTQDYVFPLSIKEAEQYYPLFPDFKGNNWLRTPGSAKNSVAFLNGKGSIMDYGYEAASEEFTVHPVMWFSIK